MYSYAFIIIGILHIYTRIYSIIGGFLPVLTHFFLGIYWAPNDHLPKRPGRQNAIPALLQHVIGPGDCHEPRLRPPLKCSETTSARDGYSFSDILRYVRGISWHLMANADPQFLN